MLLIWFFCWSTVVWAHNTQLHSSITCWRKKRKRRQINKMFFFFFFFFFTCNKFSSSICVTNTVSCSEEEHTQQWQGAALKELRHNYKHCGSQRVGRQQAAFHFDVQPFKVKSNSAQITATVLKCDLIIVCAELDTNIYIFENIKSRQHDGRSSKFV